MVLEPFIHMGTKDSENLGVIERITGFPTLDKFSTNVSSSL